MKTMAISLLKRLIIIHAGIFLAACSTVETAADNSADSDSKDVLRARLQVKPYTIGVDDQVRISVWGNPDLSMVMPVRPDGKISMPLIGDVQAGGLTPEQVAKNIKTKLSRYIKNPNVTVILTELRSHVYISRVRVTGAVQSQISIPYRQGMTVLDVILAAGGTTEFAAPGRSKLYRTIDNKTKIISIDLDAILNDGELSSNKKLIPGDIISVPERFL